MSLETTLDALEEKYFGEWEEDSEPVIEALRAIHEEAISKGIEEFRAFEKEARERFSGIYIPYIFWVELGEFLKNPENRTRLFELIYSFANSSFEEQEQKKMRSLLVTYFSMEKEFEVDKVKSLVLEKTHPAVQEYFHKLMDFVEKNKTSVDMYVEKFRLIHTHYPDFELLKMPVVKIKELISEQSAQN